MTLSIYSTYEISFTKHAFKDKTIQNLKMVIHNVRFQPF